MIPHMLQKTVSNVTNIAKESLERYNKGASSFQTKEVSETSTSAKSSSKKSESEHSLRNADVFERRGLDFRDSNIMLYDNKGSKVYIGLDLSGVSDAIKRLSMDDWIDANYGPTFDKIFNEVPEISDEFVLSFLQLGETVERPKAASDMDDMAWGMLTFLGGEIGMTDPDGLMQITSNDLKVYYDIRYHKTEKDFAKLGEYDQNGELVKRYENPEDVWKDIFLTDEGGNFLRDNKGELVRNQDFTYTISVQTDSSVIIHDTPWELRDGAASGTKLVSDYGHVGLMFTIFGVVDGNDFLFNNTMQNRDVVFTEQAFGIGTRAIDNPQSKEEKIMGYKSVLAGFYEGYKVEHEMFSRIYDLSYEGQESLYKQKVNNSEWVTFKPFETGSYRDESSKIKK